MIEFHHRPWRLARGGLSRIGLLGLLLLCCSAAAPGTRWPALNLRSGAGTADGQRLLTRGVTLSPQFISPGVSPGVQDNALLSMTIATNDSLFIGVFLDSANGEPVPNALLACFCPIFNAANVAKTVTIGGTFEAGGSDVTLNDGLYSVVVRAVTFSSSFGDTGRIEEDRLPLTIDRQAPRFVSVPVVKDRKSTPYRNGDTIVIEARLDAKGYTVTADFTELDSDNSAEATQIIDNGDGSYTIRHTLSDGNTRPDGKDLSVPLAFKDKAGNTLRDTSLFFCMVNTPPRITSVRFVGVSDTPRFKNGDTLNVETRWEPRDTPLTLTPLAWGIADPFDPRAVAITPPAPGDNLYLIRYVIPSNNSKQDGDYCLRIQAATTGCGLTVDQTKICATLDNARIATLTFDTFAPTTRDTTLTLTGRAPGAETVRFKRGDTIVTTAAVNAEGQFTAHVSLVDGLNTLLAESFDKFGSKGPTQEFAVTRVTRGFIELASRIKPGALIRVATSQTATAVRVEMWDLAGNLVAALEDNRRRDYYEFTWDGRNSTGEVLGTGPLLCRIDASLVDGRHEITNRAIVFTAR